MSYEELCEKGRTIYETLEECIEMIDDDINIIGNKKTSRYILADPNAIYDNWLNDLEETIIKLKKRNS